MSDEPQQIGPRGAAARRHRRRRRLVGRAAIGFTMAAAVVIVACSAVGDGTSEPAGESTATAPAATDPDPTDPTAPPDGPSGSTGPATTESASTVPATAPGVDGATVWTGEDPPTAGHRTLLDALPSLFAPATQCRPIADDDPDALGTYPQGPDDATIECEYPGRAVIVYSLFPGDAAMNAFFDGRLEGRQLPRGAGEIGPIAPWTLDYADDAERGSGSIFGYQRFGDGARSEVGFVRAGTGIYAYSYTLGSDFAGYYTWWASVFGGPAPAA